MQDAVDFVLVHSPLVGPMTWSLVAVELLSRGHRAIAPTLFDATDSSLPYWQQHAQVVAQSVSRLTDIADIRRLILVGHSGAGPLLPAIRKAIQRPVNGYIFVDAGLPRNNMSRLDAFESSQAADEFRQAAVNGLLPTCVDEDLRDAIPDAQL